MKKSWLLGSVVIAAVGGGAYWGYARWNATPSSADPKVAAVEEQSAAIVALPDVKRNAAALQTATAEPRVMQTTRLVPGRVQYDDTRHIEIKAAADGVLIKLLVKPGDAVKAGQVLAVLSSPEIGAARADVLKRQAELAIAERTHDWQSQTCKNLQELLLAIRERQPMKKIEATFEQRPLGDHRSTLFTAYSRFLLAESLTSNIKTAVESGAIPARAALERTNEREAAEAALKAGCEQSSFDARRKCDEALANLDDVRRRLDISRQHLTALLGYDESQASVVSTAPQEAISLVESRAPFDGTIERRTYSASERVRYGDTLFVLADTRRLWIAADLREREWSALKLSPGQELLVESPALGDRKLTARVYYIGREVSPESNAVPLVAEIDNSEGLLRPGLFVRVAVPLEPAAEVLTVPSSAVVEHEQSRFVFVSGDAEGEFRRQDIHTGRDDGQWIEVTDGLAAGTKVVSHGAFVLKSELLLERE